jgi:hypothetical protein
MSQFVSVGCQGCTHGTFGSTFARHSTLDTVSQRYLGGASAHRPPCMHGISTLRSAAACPDGGRPVVHRWNTLAADSLGVHLQLMPMLLGFLTYKGAVIARGRV